MATFEELFQKFVKIAPDLNRVAGELKALEVSVNVINQSLENSSVKILGYFNEIQKLQKEAVLEIGFMDFDNQIEASIELFKELNKAGKEYAITQENINKTQFDLSAAFEATGINLGDLTKQVAQNSNLVERSKLVQFVKDLSFQQRQGSKIAGQFTDKLIGLSLALKRPPAELINLTQGLLNSNATFAQSDKALERLAIRSSEVGRRFNTTSDSLNKALDATFTIQQRQQQASRISQIAGRLNIAPDTSGLLSSDPEVRQKAIVKIISEINDRAKNLSPSMRQALVAALGTTVVGTALGTKGLRSLGQRDFDLRAVEARARGAAGVQDVDAARRRAVTTAERLDIRVRAKSLERAQEQLRAAQKAGVTSTDKMTKATVKLADITEKTVTELSKTAGGLAASATTLVSVVVAFMASMSGIISQMPQGANRRAAEKAIDDMKATLRRFGANVGSVVPGGTVPASDQ